MSPLLNEMGDLVTQDMEKAEVLNAAVASALLARLAFRNPTSRRPGGKAGARKKYPLWKRIRSGNT